MLFIRSAILAILGLLIGASVHATTINFDNLASDTALTMINGVTFSSNITGYNLITSKVFVTTSTPNSLGVDDGGTQVLIPGDTITLDFATSITSISVKFVSSSLTPANAYSLTTTQGTVLSDATPTTTLSDGSEVYVVSYSSVAPFSSVTLATTLEDVFSFNIDDISFPPPSVSFDSLPLRYSNQSSGPISFSSDLPAIYQCKIDNDSYAPCTSPFNYTGLANGQHTISIIATDGAGNASAPFTYTWAVNTALAASSAIMLPQTGQTRCYNTYGVETDCNGTGQDGELHVGMPWPVPRFADNGEGAIIDNLTGLAWVKDANLMITRDPSFDSDFTVNDGKVSWQNALEYIKKLNNENYQGHNDWRLPNVNELRSLLNRGQTSLSSWLTSQGFINTIADAGNNPYYWTSTTYPIDPSRALTANLDYGNLLHVAKSGAGGPCFVLPVRNSAGQIFIPKTGQTNCYGPSHSIIPCDNTGQDGQIQAGINWPNSRFVLQADQSVVDSLTGLVWSSNANLTPQRKNWQEAIDYITSLNNTNYLGFNDWRLPNINELLTFTNFSQSNTAAWLNSQDFSDVQYNGYWSSTSDPHIPGAGAYTLYLDVGYSFFSTDTSASVYVWPVRGGYVLQKLTVTKAGPGSVVASSGSLMWNGSTGTTRINPGDSVTLNATPDPGYVFTGWSGDCTGTGVCLLIMNVAKNVTASFIYNPVDSPTNISVQSPSIKGELTVHWTNPSDPNFNHIHVYRSTASGQIGTLVGGDITGTTFTDTNLSSQTSYYYTVRSVSAEGGESINTEQVSQTTLDSAPPVITLTSAPLRYSNQASGSILFTANEPATFECKLDGDEFATCISPFDYNSFPNGQHSFSIKATDGSANTSVPIVYNWTLNTALAASSVVLLPQTGQTKCYNASGNEIVCDETGQDGDIRAGEPWAIPRFTDNGNGTVTDTLTGLMWNQDGNTAGLKSWQQALDYIKSLNSQNYLGYKDWRLPNINELTSINNPQQNNPATWLNSQVFVNVQNWYWSSTTIVNSPTYVKYLNTYDGTVSIGGKSYSYYVWPVRDGQHGLITLPKTGQTSCYNTAGTFTDCVGTGQDGELQRGADWPSPRFNINPDQTVTDNLTGLIWISDASSAQDLKSWQQALEYINTINSQNYLGYSDWRLPNRNEIYSLVNNEPSTPSNWLISQGFKNVLPDWYWSSTSYVDFAGDAWTTNMGSVNPDHNSKTVGFFSVWPVRGGYVQPKLTITKVGNGAVTPSTGSINWNGLVGMMRVAPGDSITLSAAPDPGYVFTGWSGGCSGTVSCTIAMTVANNVTATFIYNPVNPPSNINVLAPTTKGQLTVTWTNPADSNFDHIHVYRSTTSGQIGTLVGDNIAGTAFTDTSLSSQTTYYYTVKAVTVSGGESINTDQVSQTTLDATPPVITITSSPLRYSNQAAGSIVFTANEPATFECKVDTGEYSTCASPFNYSGLSNSQHTFNVKATDGANNTSSPVSYIWTINTSLVSSSAIMLPQTGQTKCYNVSGSEISCDGTGQDGDIQAGVPWPSLRFTDNGDQTVTDNLTGMIWAKDANPAGVYKTWQQALDYIKELNSQNYLGHSDWRLPSWIELYSMINKGQAVSATWLSTEGFTNIQPNPSYWSSNTSSGIGYSGSAVGVYFDDGTVWNYPKYNSLLYVWPVRSGPSGSLLPKTGQTVCYNTDGLQINCTTTGQDGESQLGVDWPNPRFTDNSNGTQTDNLTGLMWAKNSYLVGTEIKWQEALDFIKNINDSSYLGHSDWRLPNINELNSINNAGQVATTWLTDQGFTNIKSNFYWSSSTNVYYPHVAFGVSTFLEWVSSDNNKSNFFNVWPVRGGYVQQKLTVTMTGNSTGSVAPDSGSLNWNGSVGSTRNAPGTPVLLTASPAAGASVTWTGCDSSTITTCTVTMSATKNVTVDFSDLTPPAAPSGIAVQPPTSNNQLSLSWINPTDPDFSHINIYRSTVSGTLGSLVANDLTGTSWNDTGLASYTTFYYTVRSVDAVGNESTNTAQVSQRTLDSTNPVASFSMPLTSNSATVTLTFSATDNSGTVTGYCVSETNNSAGCRWVDSAPTSYSFSNVPATVPTDKTLYAFARDAAGNISTVVSATVTITIPDTTLPSAAVTDPVNGAALDFLFEIMGTASDEAGGSGLNRVELQISVVLGSTTYYINSLNQHTSIPTWVTASGTSSWIFNTSLTSWQQNKPYTIKARAVDNAGNVSAFATSFFSLGLVSQNVTLQLSKSEAAAGTVTSNPSGLSCDLFCSTISSTYTFGTQVTLTATPASGYYFIGWSNCDNPVGTTCVVAATTSHPTITAIFNTQKATNLSISPRLQSLRLNDSQTISGQLATIPAAASPDLNGQQIKIAVTGPNGVQNFTATTSDTSGNWSLPLSIFTKKGTYLIKATFDGATKLIGSQSDTATVLVEKSAGYAIVVLGKITGNEGLNDHKYTTDTIVTRLKERSFLDEDILYLKSTESTEVTKTQVQQAIEVWARDKMNASPAPLYLVMVDHGSPHKFHLGSEYITSHELDGWITTMEGSLNPEAAAENRIIVIGTCYSGSFINVLSRLGRTLIASAGEFEESIRGPKIPTQFGFVRSGEYFLDELFTHFSRGETIGNSFRKARETIRVKDPRQVSPGIHAGVYDTLAQHPLLDDDGDGVGHYDIDSGPDGLLVASLTVGEGAVRTNASDNPADIKQVAPTIFLQFFENSAALWLEANQNSRVGEAWIEIRKPDTTVSGGGTSQIIVDLETVPLMYNTFTGRWETTYNSISMPGTYEVYYYTKDSQTGEVSPMARTTVYKNVMDSTSPMLFNLRSPNGSEERTMLAFEWEPSSDPDGLSYSLLVASDSGFANVVYRREGIAGTLAVIPFGILHDVSSYYWRVIAIDSYGAQRASAQSYSFTTNDTTCIPTYITGIVRNSVSGAGIPNASVHDGTTSSLSRWDGSYLVKRSCFGPVTVTFSAGGYVQQAVNLTTAPFSTLTRDVFMAPVTDSRLTVNITGDGTVNSNLEANFSCDVSSCFKVFPYGTLVSLYATPGSLSTFTAWGVACSGNSNCDVFLDGDKSVNAVFTGHKPFRINGINHSHLQSAYSAASDNASIRIMAGTWLGNLAGGDMTADGAKTVTVEGGYDDTFTDNSAGDATVIKGRVNIKAGRINVRNLKIQ